MKKENIFKQISLGVILLLIVVISVIFTGCDINDDFAETEIKSVTNVIDNTESEKQNETESIDDDTEQIHKCVYNQKVADERYFYSSATNTEGTKYYYSCVCGVRGTEIFDDGDVIPAEGLKFTESANGYEISEYRGNLSTVIIPSKYKGQSVTSIGVEAFFGCTNLESIVIPESVTNIDIWAFVGCTNLKNVTVSDSLTSIGFEAFVGCENLVYNEYDNAYYLGNTNNPYIALIEVKDTDIVSCEINKSTKVIGSYAFRDCTNIVDIIIPESVTGISSSAFKGCTNLQNISIPDTITKIDEMVFDDCMNLIYNEYDNAYYLGNTKNPCVVLIKAKSKDIASCNIHTSAKIIYEYAFKGCVNISNMIIPNGVVGIRNGAFYGCTSLIEITIPNSVSNIENAAFYDCTSLKSITIPNSVNSIKDWTFFNCDNLLSIIIPDSVKIIGRYAFSRCDKLNNVIIPDSVFRIEDSAFYGCENLENITIGNGITGVGDTVFSYTSIECNKYDNAYYLGNEKNQYFLLINVSGNREHIGVCEINSNTKIICYRAFEGCKELKSIIIPDSVERIGTCAFYDCESLTDIVFESTVTDWIMIEKDVDWDFNTGDYTVTCTDGKLDKNGNIIIE